MKYTDVGTRRINVIRFWDYLFDDVITVTVKRDYNNTKYIII